MARLPTPKLPGSGGALNRIRSGARRVRYAVSDVAFAIEHRARSLVRNGREALIPDRLAARAGRLGYSLRAAGGRAGELLRAGGRRMALVWARLRGLWLRLSLRTRQVVGAVLAVVAVAILFWLLAVPNLPCRFPGGDRCPPPDDAAGLVPADALAYLHTNLDPDTGQAAAAAQFADELPTLSAQLIDLAPRPGGSSVDFAKQILPWLGGEAAIGVIAGEGGAPEQVYLLEIADQAGADRFATQLLGGGVSTVKRGDVEMRVDKRGVATATVGGFLVVGTEVAVQRVIDTEAAEGRSLADSAAATSVADALPDDSLLQAYVSEDGAQRLLQGNRGPLSTLDTFLNFDATAGAGAAVVVSPDGLEIELHSELDPARLQTSPGFFGALPPFDPTLADELAPRTLAYLGLGDPQTSIQLLLEQAQSQAPGLVVGFEDFAKRLQKSGKVDLENEVLPVLRGQGAFAIEPASAGGPGGSSAGGGTEGEAGGGGKASKPPKLPGINGDQPGLPPLEDVSPTPGAATPQGVLPQVGVPFLSFIGTDVDPVQASEALAKLQAPLAKALAGGSGQAPTFEEGDVDGIPTHSVDVSAALNLTYAAFDGKLVLSTQPDGISQVASGPGGLSSGALFQRATDGFPDQPALLLYLNLRELLALAEGAGLADDPAYALLATEAHRLAAAAVAVDRGETTLNTTLRLSLAEPAE